jgi:3-deoxy-7-phosphoheptulonate synthase
MYPTQDINILGTVPLTAPRQLKLEQPARDVCYELVTRSREEVKRILAGDDDRLMIVVGPCSIHNRESGLEYARRLKALADKVNDRLLLIMRVYFEKPRTTVGWKGLINDPHLNDTFDIATGLRMARGILIEVAELGMPAATEMLEPITPQYIADLITLASIGARTTESPTHRQMASGLSMPVGYKNGTDGDLDVAINAMQAAKSQHTFLGIDPEGKTCMVQTKGNPWGHLILRGGRSGPNYDPASLKDAAERLHKAGLSPRFLVDCSHANSNKDYSKQSVVWNDVLAQRQSGNRAVIGMMVESNLNPGNQPLPADPALLQYGVSITDGCIGWDETESLILTAYETLRKER